MFALPVGSGLPTGILLRSWICGAGTSLPEVLGLFPEVGVGTHEAMASDMAVRPWMGLIFII